MTTYTRSKPCRSCGGTEYRTADHRCVKCFAHSVTRYKHYQSQQFSQLKVIKDYASLKLNAADPAQAFMARVICTFTPKHIKTLKYKPEQIMNMLVYGEYDELMIYDFQQLLVSQHRRSA